MCIGWSTGIQQYVRMSLLLPRRLCFYQRLLVIGIMQKLLDRFSKNFWKNGIWVAEETIRFWW